MFLEQPFSGCSSLTVGRISDYLKDIANAHLLFYNVNAVFSHD